MIEDMRRENTRRVNTYLNVHEMFPEAANIAKILGWLQYYWVDIVGRDVAAFSRPYKLGFEELCVYFSKPFAKTKLIRMKGTILRTMCKRFGYEKGEKFDLTLTEQLPVRITPVKPPMKRLQPKIEVNEERVRHYMEGAPETLPEDINHAISHLQAFLEKVNRRG